MNEEDKLRLDHLCINRVDYYFRCQFAFDKKEANCKKPSVQLRLYIWDDTNKKEILWEDYKGSYLAEKLNDYIRNSLNGQRSIYYDNKVPKNFN